MIVCVCHNVSESQIKSAIKAGADTMHALRDELGIGASCGKCKSCTKKILREHDAHHHHKKSHQLIQFYRFAT